MDIIYNYAFFVMWFTDSDKNDSEIADTSSQTIPVVGLLIQGSPRDIDLVLFYLRNKMPVVVVKGTGGCADLLAYALEESQERYLPMQLFKIIHSVIFFSENVRGRVINWITIGSLMNILNF